MLIVLADAAVGLLEAALVAGGLLADLLARVMDRGGGDVRLHLDSRLALLRLGQPESFVHGHLMSAADRLIYCGRDWLAP